MKKKTSRRPANRRRRYGGKRGRNGKQVGLSIGRSLGPIPQRFVTHMKYTDTYLLTAQSTYLQKWRLNSVYDPDYSGSGHQPYGFDQLSPLFTGYRVFATSYSVVFQSDSTCYGVIVPINGTTLPTEPSSLTQVMEMPRAKWALYASGGNAAKLRGKSYLPSLMGVRVGEYKADNNYSSAVGGNPVLGSTLCIFFSSPNPVSDEMSVTMTVTLTYHVEFISPVMQDSS